MDPPYITPPMWFRYLTGRNGRNPVYYEFRIDLNDNGYYVVTRRWGTYLDQGRSPYRQEVFETLGEALAEADHGMQELLDAGYRLAIRPASADSQLDEDE